MLKEGKRDYVPLLMGLSLVVVFLASGQEYIHISEEIVAWFILIGIMLIFYAVYSVKKST